VYTIAKYNLALGQLGWVNGTTIIRALLVGDSYVFNPAHSYVSDIAAHEVGGGTYARQSVGGRAVYLDLAGDRARIDANDVVFPALSGVNPSGMILYKQVGGNDLTPADDFLVCFVDAPTAVPTGQNYVVEFDPAGIFAVKSA
jgi:hypothetical protein